jgi:serine/threonine protein kinase
MGAQKKSLGPFQGPNEEAAFHFLAENLPSTWYVIANRQLDTAKHEEVDFFVLGENNLYIIEEKSWGPKVIYGDLRWIVTDSSGKYSERKSPFIDVSTKARITAGWLREKIAGFSNIRTHKVIDIVLLTHPMIDASVRVGVNSTGKVFTLKEIAHELLTYDKQNNDGVFNAHHDAILRLLLDYSHRDVHLPKFRDFKIKARLEADDNMSPTGIKKYEAENVFTGTEYHLKCYVNSYFNQEEDKPQRQIKRDYRVSEKLQATQRAWRQSAPFLDPENDLIVYPFEKPEGALSLSELKTESNKEIYGLYSTNLVNLMLDAFNGLEDLNSAGILHRTLSPSRIWITRGLRVIFNDFMISHHEGDFTVGPSVEDFPSREFRAPECLENIYLSQHKSDVFALAKSLRQTFLTLQNESEPVLSEILMKCMVPDFESRFSARDVIDELLKYLHPEAIESQTEIVEATDSIVGDIETELFARRFGQNYHVLEKLGSGVSGTSWLARHESENEMNLVVIKEARTASNFKDLDTEFINSRNFTAHPQCSRGLFLIPDPSPGFLVNTYMNGMTLKKFLEIDRLDISYVETAFLTSLDALNHIHSHGFIHGDISPNNILVEDNTGIASLIDFGDLRKFGEHTSVFGTRRTYAPEVANLGKVSEATDIYALSATFLYLLLGRSHREFEKGDQVDSFEVLPFLNDEKLQFTEEYCDFIGILFKLVNPNPTLRPDYASIKELISKRREKVPTAPNPNLEVLINPTVTQIRSLITSSKDASSGAILELLLREPEYKDFYDKTFLKTSLEKELLPEIIAGKRKVLLLTGNPGGGKTSFLHAIYEELITRGGKLVSASKVEEGSPEWVITFEGRTFHAILDASQSNGVVTANEMVKTALNGALNGDSIALIAINDGRLKQVMRSYEDEFEDLASEVERYFTGLPSTSEAFTIIDLKSRAVVDLNGDGLFSQSIGVISAPELWSTCEDCALQNLCPINSNRKLIQDKAHVSALSELTLLSYLRRSERPNFRRIRSAIGYLITGDLTCEQVAKNAQEGEISFTEYQLRNLAFEGESGDSLVDSWQVLDPAMRMSPSLRNKIASSVIQQTDDEISTKVYSEFARGTFFGETPDHFGEIVPEIAPYEHFNLYRDYLRRNAVDLRPILHGLSKLSGSNLPYRNGLYVSDVQPGIGWSVIKIIPAGEFELKVDDFANNYIETTPESLTLMHKKSGLHFRMNIDVFELIIRASRGEIFNDMETSAIRFDLNSFATMLLRSPVQEVFLIDPSGADIHVTTTGNKIYLENREGQNAL